MAMFLLLLLSEMRDHLITKDFKDCTLMSEYANLQHGSRASCAIAAVNSDYEAAISTVSGGRRRDFLPNDSCPSSPNLHRTSDTRQVRKMRLRTP